MRRGRFRAVVYLPGDASFDLHVGSAFKAILPGAFQAGFIGSVLVALFYVVTFLVTTVFVVTDPQGLTVGQFLGTIMGGLFVVMVGTLIGTVMCAIYIALIGLPIALVMRRHITSPAMLLVSIASAALAGLLAAYLLASRVVGDGDFAVIVAMCLGYAIPAGILYRRAIITERMFSIGVT